MDAKFTKASKGDSPGGATRPLVPSTGASSDPFTSLSFSLPNRGLIAPAPREIEFRYLVPPHLLSSIIGSSDPKSIVQHYFPPSSLKGLLKRFSVHALVAGADSFTSARVRKTLGQRGDVSYDIEFKGPKEKIHDLRISRAELGISISPKEFKELRAAATAGMVRKLRYEVEGAVRYERASIPIIAQIDVFKMAGSPSRRLEQEYVTADIELSEARLVLPFCGGNHTFSFLSECIDMNANGKKIRKHLSSSQVAHAGLGKKQLAALDKAAKILARRNSVRAE